MPGHYRELITMVETGLAQTIEAQGTLPAPVRGRLSGGSRVSRWHRA